MSTPTRRRPGPGGFTLIEVMVALAVLALIAVMAWQGVDGIARTRAATQTRLEQTMRLQTVLGQFEQDLTQLQESPAAPAIAFDGATLRLTRRAETGLQVVAWSLRPNDDASGSTWLRWAGPPARTVGELQETWLRTQQFQGLEAGQLRTLTGLTQWQVLCFRGGRLSNCQSTGDIVTTVVTPAPAASAASGAASAASSPAPAVRQREAIPDAVRVILTFAGPDLSGSLTRDIALGP